MAVRAVCMRPFLAESLNFARFGYSGLFPVFGDRHIVMTHEAFADSLCLMHLMVKGHAVFEMDDICSTSTGRNQHKKQGNLFQYAPPGQSWKLEPCWSAVP